MRIGIVCPYSFDVPGGVQFHVRDLAEQLRSLGHTVSVLAPEGADLPEYYFGAGKAVAVPYNGSVARLNFGPIVARKTSKWLAQGNFDVLHLHEPWAPSLSLLALWLAKGPIVATFHTALEKSRARQIVGPIVGPLLEKITGRIAVSAEARRTLVQFEGGDAAIIPNGVYVDNFVRGQDPPGSVSGNGPHVAFLGRVDEPRKGLPILAEAIPAVLQAFPSVQFHIAGRGEAEDIKQQLQHLSANVHFLGGISEAEKVGLLQRADVYVAPQTGGESFGIVLVEAMAAGTTVLASNIAAFNAVLAGGQYGALFTPADPTDLATHLIALLGDKSLRQQLQNQAQTAVGNYDWGQVTSQILAVYESAIAAERGQVTATDVARPLFRAEKEE